MNKGLYTGSTVVIYLFIYLVLLDSVGVEPTAM
jgi:hypothetical protein